MPPISPEVKTAMVSIPFGERRFLAVVWFDLLVGFGIRIMPSSGIGTPVQ